MTKVAHRRTKAYSADYHDYVFRDGKLVGDFDNMYRYAKEIPWNQDKRCHDWYTEVGILMLKNQAPYDQILELGCGLGYFSAKLRQLAGRHIDAMDVSSRAVLKARALHPGISFTVADITKRSCFGGKQYDLVVVRDVFWYVFEQMKSVVQNINSSVRPGGYLYICQSFPALNNRFVGKKVIPNPDALLVHFSGYEPLYTARLRNHGLVQDGPILHFLGVKSK